MVTNSVKIFQYKESWPVEFQQIGRIQRLGLGELALRIDHIGSTSVPGLAAKDVIDIQITVAGFDDRMIDALNSIGYTLRQGVWHDHVPAGFIGPETEWEKLIFNPPEGQRRTHTHVRIQGRANQRYALLFRDFLRLHPAIASSYAELKRRLAENLLDPGMYPDVKDPAVDLIYLPAEEWAIRTNWQPGPSDS